MFLAFVLFSGAALAQNAPAPAPAAATTAAPMPVTPAQPFVYAPKPTDVTLGKKNAPVVVVEYASLSCPHCSHFYNDALPQLTEKYIDTGKVLFVYRSYPLNAPALKAAELVQCADKDSRHIFVKVLFATQAKWAYDFRYEDALAGIAALGGIPRDKFDACMKDKTIEAAVLAVAKEGQDLYHIRSTPTFYFNGLMHEGYSTLDGMEKLFDDAIAAKNTPK
jgi:protein-disulfide isomerase